jgi:hypothetical protein
MSKSLLLYLIPAMLIGHAVTGDGSGCKKEVVAATHEQDSTVLRQLIEIDKKGFIDQPVDSFLKHPVFSKYTSFYFKDEPYGVLSKLQLRYSPRVWIDIVVYEYKFVQQESGNRKWKLDEYRKEKISRIDLVYDHTVVQETGYSKASDKKQ